MEKKRIIKTKSIVTGHLEKIGAKVLDDFSSVITDIIKGHQGIYALFKKDRLYYVGLARDLKRRINAHNKDRHQNKWTHFSLYIIRKEEHIKEIESLVLRIAYPAGNKIKGNLKRSNDLRPLLKSKLKDQWIKQLDGIIGHKTRSDGKISKVKIKKSDGRPLQGYFSTGKSIYANYKNKEYRAFVFSNGRIKVNGKIFNSPSMAGMEVTKKIKLNGWKFWKYKDKNGELVYIDKLRNNR
ncbi:MAG: GIY-YIG nuclease family protein [Sedimentisphaerales bacterium]|nr:GIY-YIG nuclease family protein [Sedimentisphaerales bacterium]